MSRALVIGAGPAGLMAAGALARAGVSVVVAEAKPSVGRKFLMAGKSGLNLTKDEELVKFRAQYGAASGVLAPMLAAFGPEQTQAWARALGQEVFTGSSGRVFPKVMKASPLLRAWLAEVTGSGVEIRTRWRWVGWDGAEWRFETPQGSQRMAPDCVVLAMGGASWQRLGSDGAWAAQFTPDVAPFAPANAGLDMAWSSHMAKVYGQPLKAVSFQAGALTSRGEAVISARGLEGGGLYPLTPALREGAALFADLLPDLDEAMVRERLARPRGKESLSNHLRKVLRLDPVKLALLQEFARPLPDDLAPTLKRLPLRHLGLRPMDEAISTAGGLRFDALDAGLMLCSRPGVFACGEMLDWEAPTGGYLLTGCLATGLWAGQHAALWLKNSAA